MEHRFNSSYLMSAIRLQLFNYGEFNKKNYSYKLANASVEKVLLIPGFGGLLADELYVLSL